jgi:hypothetical protein
MDNYSLGDLAQPYQPEDDIMDQFRTAAADIMSTVDINPYTQRLRDLEQQAQGANLSMLGDPASMGMGMTGPMMGQMMDPAMMPPEMLGQPPMSGPPMSGPPMSGPPMGQPPMGGMPPAQDPMMGQMDPMGGQQTDMMNNPGMNNLGI